MSEQSALLKLIGFFIVAGIWFYLMTSKHPDIVKERNTTQKFVYSGLALFFLYIIATA